MIVGTTRELKDHEYRVGLTPANVAAYVEHGHTVLIETNAGYESGFADEEYVKAGGQIIPTAKEVFEKSDMIIKVKEPEECEFELLKDGQVLYTYLHLAPNAPLTDALLKKNIKAVAYETVTDKDGRLPCLIPMSRIAGRLSIQEGAKYLEKEYGGRGILLSGVDGVECGKVVVLGGGTAGTYACKAAVGVGAEVTLIDISQKCLDRINEMFEGKVRTLISNEENVKMALADADLVVGTVLVPGGSTPKLVRREHLKLMKKGAVIVDVAIDQGGCCESSHVTVHSDPVFVEEGIVHYCVGNMPGAVSRTSTIALTNATIEYGLILADNGLEQAVKMNKGIADGLNTYLGKITNKNVAVALNREYVPAEEAVK